MTPFFNYSLSLNPILYAVILVLLASLIGCESKQEVHPSPSTYITGTWTEKENPEHRWRFMLTGRVQYMEGRRGGYYDYYLEDNELTVHMQGHTFRYQVESLTSDRLILSRSHTHDVAGFPAFSWKSKTVLER